MAAPAPFDLGIIEGRRKTWWLARNYRGDEEDDAAVRAAQINREREGRRKTLWLPLLRFRRGCFRSC
jgi:hypothetical protein